MLKSTPSLTPSRMMSALDMVDERRLNLEARALDAGLGRQLRQPLERLDEFRPAIGIARVVDGVDARRKYRRTHTSAQPSASDNNSVLRAGT